jgi:hypothetical protein
VNAPSLSRDEAKRRLLWRQGLSVPLGDKDEAMHVLVAVQTQYAASLNVALAARTVVRDPDYETRGLALGGTLVKGWSLRNTLHAHLRDDHRLVLSVVGPARHGGWRNWLAGAGGLDTDAIDALQSRILEALEPGPLSRPELHARVPELRSIPGTGWGVDVMGLSLRGLLAVIGVGREQRFALMQGYEPVPDAETQLLRRYLAAFGPASAQDFAHWTGFSVAWANEVVSRSGEELFPFQIEGRKGTVYDVVEEVESPDPPAATLLAKFDPLILAHRNKDLVFPPERRSDVLRKAGQVEALVLLKGEAAGTWRLSRTTKAIKVQIEPWRNYKKGEIGALDKQGTRLAKSLGVKTCEVLVQNL